MKIGSIIALSVLLASSVAQADEYGVGQFKITLDPLPSPTSSLEPKGYRPPTGIPFLILGSVLTTVGTAGAAYAVSLPAAPGIQFQKAVVVDVVSDMVALTGLAFMIVGVAQNYHYDLWMRKHPWLAGISPGGYRLVF